MKKILALILALSMLPIMYVHAEEVQTEAQTEAQAEEIQEVNVKTSTIKTAQSDKAIYLLEYLGIGDKGFYEKETVSRQEFAKMLGQIISVKSDPKIQIYADVSVDSDYYPYIYTLATMNIMRGYDDSTFSPNKAMTLNEAYAACVNALGYRPLAELQGGWLTGYSKVVNELELYYGLNNKGNELSGMDAAILIYNTLNTYTTESVTGTIGKTLLDLNFDMVGYTGNVSQIGQMSTNVNSKSLTDDSIIISGVTYSIKKSYAEKMSKYLGYNMEYYVRDEDNDAEVVLMFPYKTTNTLTVMWEDIENVSVSNGILIVEYYDETKNKQSKIRMEKDAAYVLNDRASVLTGYEFEAPGTVTTFVDINDDGRYELARISQYDNMIVSTVDIANEMIYGKYEIYAEEDISPNIGEIKIIQNGTLVGSRNIHVGDILSIYKGGEGSNQKKTIIINSDITVSGKLKSVSNKKYTVEEQNGEETTLKEYSPAYSFTRALEMGLIREPQVGENVTLRLDAQGLIADVKYGSSENRFYAFVNKIKWLNDNPDPDEVKFSLHVFTEKGEWKDYEFADRKINVNDIKMTQYSAIKSYLQNADGSIVYQLLKLQVNSEDKITRLYVAQTPTNDDDAEKRYINGTFTQSFKPLERYYSNKGGKDVMFAENPGTPNWGYGEVEEATVDFAVSTATKVIKIPPKNSPKETMEKDDLYSVGTGDMFPRWEWAYTTGYDSDRYGMPTILVWNAPEGKESDIMMVKGSGDIYNEETGELEQYIEVATSSGFTTYRTEKTELFAGLKKGDLITVKCDMEDKEKRHVVSLKKYAPSEYTSGTVVGISNGMIRIIPGGKTTSTLYAITAKQGAHYDGKNVELVNAAALRKGMKILYKEYFGAIRAFVVVD